MALHQVNRSNISDQVYEQLKNQLLRGEWKQGDKIPSENELCKSFGVSRVTVRQALQKLTTLGLTETRLGEGSFVKELKPGIFINEMVPLFYLGKDATKEVMEFRLIFEVESAGIAAEKATPEGIALLRASVEASREGVGELEKYVDEDFRFHLAIAEMTGNSLIIQLNYLIQDILRSAIQKVTKEIGYQNGLHYHSLITEAIASGDTELAKKMMWEHVQNARNNLK